MTPVATDLSGTSSRTSEPTDSLEQWQDLVPTGEGWVHQLQLELGIELLGSEHNRRIHPHDPAFPRDPFAGRWCSLLGAAAGAGLALVGGRLVAGFLHGLQPTDPVAVGSAAALVLLTATVSGYLPARRAAGIDPIEALRAE